MSNERSSIEQAGSETADKTRGEKPERRQRDRHVGSNGVEGGFRKSLLTWLLLRRGGPLTVLKGGTAVRNSEENTQSS